MAEIEYFTVTGTSTSRLSELRKYTVTQVFADMYVNRNITGSDGVDYYVSISGERIIYYLGDIRYVDTIASGITTGTVFSFETTLVIDNPQFDEYPIYKNLTKENIVSSPKINDDVFIVRQELSAFDGNYKLEFIKNLVQLESFAGGNFFNIVNNI